jgi:integrase
VQGTGSAQASVQNRSRGADADPLPDVPQSYLTGWRFASEVLTLKWEQVDLENKIVRLEPGTTKNDEGRTFPFSDYHDLDQLLREQRHKLPRSPFVFNYKGDQIRTYRRRWQTACKSAGVVAIVHDLRRTAVRNMVRAGIPQVYAMKLTGHKTDSVFRRYAISDEAALSEQTAKLAGLSNRSTGTAGQVIAISRPQADSTPPKVNR